MMNVKLQFDLTDWNDDENTTKRSVRCESYASTESDPWQNIQIHGEGLRGKEIEAFQLIQDGLRKLIAAMKEGE